MRKIGSVQQKILLALAGGVALGLSSNPNQYFKTLRKIHKEWAKINQGNFNRSLERLSKEKLIAEKILKDGSVELVLTQEGKRQAERLKIFGSSIGFKKPKKWDGKWRIILFDIPEKDRLFRNILREHLYVLKFFKLQHSVFVSPHPFEKQILDLVAVYVAEKYVRVITATGIDNEDALRKHFFK